METRAHIIVTGLVQGVGYRWFVSHHALQLGLAGFVRNLREGSVEVEVEGERSLVQEMIGQLRLGPRAAHVTDLRVEWLEPSRARTPSSEKFEIR
jgi:acylphosphatase